MTARKPRSVSLSASYRAVIDLLVAHGALSRADIARALRLSKPAVSSAVANLIARGAIQEVGVGESAGGRRPILLRLGGAGQVVAGVEIDPKFCRIALTDLDGQVLEMHEAPLRDPREDAVADLVADDLRAQLATRPDAMFLGCGIAVPGLRGADGDTVTYATTLAWDRVNLRPLLAARLQAPVVLVNRGKAAALGELWYRGRAPQADLIYIYLGTGVGGGILLNNAVHEGADRAAGEIGHMIVDPRGPLCKCGNHGCLETLISGPAVALRAQAAIKAGRATLLTQWLAGQSLDVLTAKMVADAALAGDPLALEILEQTAGYLGIAVANLVNLLNPQLVVLGGPASRWGNLLLEATQRAVQQRALDVPRRSVRIVLSQAGDVTVTLGAAAMILRQASQLLTAGW